MGIQINKSKLKDKRKAEITAEADELIADVIGYPRISQATMASILELVLISIDPSSTQQDKNAAINAIKTYRPVWSWRNAVRAEESARLQEVDELPPGVDPKTVVPNYQRP